MTKNKNQSQEVITLRSLREAAGLTQEELARELKVAKSTIGFYESGKKIPRLDNFVQMSRKLGVSLKTLAKAFKVDVSGIPNDEEVSNNSKK